MVPLPDRVAPLLTVSSEEVAMDPSTLKVPVPLMLLLPV